MNERPGVLLNGMRKDCSSEFGNWDRLFFQHDGLRKLERFIEKYGEEIPGVHEGERWAPSIKRPAMILCVGLNYAEAGDLILSGPPPGVGLGMDPPAYPTEVDIVELTI